MSFVMSAGLAEVETAMHQLGSHSPTSDCVLVQTCFRHFDVDRIGKSELHLSLFQMPGAFSFGHRSHRVTIQRMWDFVINELAIDPQRLWVTYFVGGDISGHHFETDLETYRAWQEIGMPDDRIVGLGADHNFWKQGGGIDCRETSRKCGPNTELFFDRGPQRRCGPECRPGCQCGRFVEFANSLFIFAEIDATTNQLSIMAQPFTETVIGSERVAMILEGKATVFEIESVRPLFEYLQSFYSTKSGEDACLNLKESERILVDHLRALVFLAADGAPPPGKGGRRRLMRILIRRVLAELQILGGATPSPIPVLMDGVIALNGDRRLHLEHGRERLLAYVSEEQAAFERTLSRGYRQLDRLLARNNGLGLRGRELVRLVKQFGVPLSLLRATLARQGVDFRESEYRKAMEQWRSGLSASGPAPPPRTF
jgi:alanyl-tRNA synthetase